ncbi:hypothetical protein [Flavobacterium pectinovorum]|uniref:Uncharacterized protein n=1 Tax=Flavobacterium pectinovorum TaxID=29533 RepID=A0A502EIH3_9FLAO|nr:hypothetical protein [Flavobacterium pectinovorum]TPG36296.1 hypothetical protein EAH81_19685 [Flavobacterium pectinovorum]
MKKLVIERTLLRFNDGIDAINLLNDRFNFLAILLNRLLSEKYNGKKIKFLNIFFYETSEKLLKAYGKEYFLHYYGGQFTYKKVIDYDYFYSLSFNDQKIFIWEKACEMLQFAGKELKNESLLISSEYAYNKGLEMNLNADYRMIENDVVLFEENYKAAVWVNFLDNKMEANFTLEKDNNIVLKKIIDQVPNGNVFFLTMFKKIEQKDSDTIIIKGLKDADYLPLEINFTKDNGKIISKN